jgi:hypothetical protein
LGYFTNAFIIGFFTLLLSTLFFPYLAALAFALLPATVIRFAYQYSIPITIVYVVILAYLMFKYGKPRLLYLIALAPALYIMLNAPMWFALWLIS